MNTRDEIVGFTTAAEARGWVVRSRDVHEPLHVPTEIVQRYGAIPPSYLPFVMAVAEARNASDQVWFWCESDLQRSDPPGFRWNEVETMCLEGACNAFERTEVISFWDRHFPIMMAVHSDYDYLAISLHGPEAGSIIHGCASDPETTRVAGTIAEWLSTLTDGLRNPDAIVGNLIVRLFSGLPTP